MKQRIDSVSNTKKITDAMKLVAAAKVRRAQEAVVNGRPFSENLVKVLYGVNQRLRTEDVDSPLINVRPVKTVLLAVVTGDRGLCGGYNNFVIKKVCSWFVCVSMCCAPCEHLCVTRCAQTEQRYAELTALGIKVQLVCIGKKGSTYFKRRPEYPIAST